MSAQHTPGRVKVQHPDAGERGWEVAFEPGLERLCADITEANARRLAACWNACEGVRTEILELAGTRQDWCDLMQELEQERNTLLAALKDMADLYDTDEGCRSLPQYKAARAAIAKVEGTPSALPPLYTAPQPAAAVSVKPVAWVDVADAEHGPYEFHGIEKLPAGKHHLFAAPPAPSNGRTA